MIGSLGLDTGEALWLSARWQPLEDSERAFYGGFRDDLRVHPAGPDDEISGASVYVCDEKERARSSRSCLSGPRT